MISGHLVQLARLVEPMDVPRLLVGVESIHLTSVSGLTSQEDELRVLGVRRDGEARWFGTVIREPSRVEQYRGA